MQTQGTIQGSWDLRELGQEQALEVLLLLAEETTGEGPGGRNLWRGRSMKDDRTVTGGFEDEQLGHPFLPALVKQGSARFGVPVRGNVEH